MPISLTLPDHAKALNICRSGAGYQASLEVASGTFRIRVAASAEEAVREVLGQQPSNSVVIVPPPY